MQHSETHPSHEGRANEREGWILLKIPRGDIDGVWGKMKLIRSDRNFGAARRSRKNKEIQRIESV